MNAITNQQITFTNTADLKGEPLQWFEWDFGDGITDTSNWNTTHTYTAVGTYTAKLTVQTRCGKCTPSTETMHITETPLPTDEIDPILILAALALVGAVGAIAITQEQ